MLKWTVTRGETGLKLVSFLKNKFPDQSARALKKAIEENLCDVNGKTERFASHILMEGDKIVFRPEKFSATSIEFDPSRLLYEDDHLLIYNKPSGIASDSIDLLQALKRDSRYLALTHRIDRDTTGILIFAKTKKMEELMKALFHERLIKKLYLAIVDGIPPRMSGVIDNHLAIKHKYQGQTIWGKASKGQHAITEWKSIAKSKDTALLQCFPKTGRTHQIRVHLSEMGHPILGDRQYGRDFQSKYWSQRQLLHAYQIEFIHPADNKQLTITAPLADDFRKAIRDLYGNEDEILNR